MFGSDIGAEIFGPQIVVRVLFSTAHSRELSAIFARLGTCRWLHGIGRVTFRLYGRVTSVEEVSIVDS